MGRSMENAMKIRIQDHSVRFRISIREAEQLLVNGAIEACAEMFSQETKQFAGRFVYGIKQKEGLSESHCEIQPGSIRLILNSDDCRRLNDPNEEGIYLRYETKLDDGTVHRFMAFVEKDRPASKCNNPETWIYNYRADQPDSNEESLESSLFS